MAPGPAQSQWARYLPSWPGRSSKSAYPIQLYSELAYPSSQNYHSSSEHCNEHLDSSRLLAVRSTELRNGRTYPTNVPIFFLLSEIRRRRISGRPRKRACAKIHPRSEFNPPVFRNYRIPLPRSNTRFLPRFSHIYSEPYHPSSELEKSSESKKLGKRTCCLLATKSSPCSVEPQQHVAQHPCPWPGRSRGLQGETGTGSALESSEETWSYTFADGWMNDELQ